MFFKEQRNQFKSFTRRSFFLLSLKLILFSIIGFRLYKIQINESSKYKTLSQSNRITLKIIYPTRGVIYDRNNIVIAENRISYNLYIIPEETDDIKITLAKISKIIPISFNKQKKIINLTKKTRKFEMIKIVDDLNWDQLEKIESNIYDYQGIHLIPSNKRHYPHNNIFSHIIGYTGQPAKEDLEIPYISPMRSLEIGRTGIEKFYNQELIGKPGSREVEINSIGREIRQISKSDSKNGKKIHLSIDSRLQNIIFEQMQNITSGSVVVLNVNTGEILGMVSKPDYNSNKIITKPNKEYWDNIINDPLTPLNNRSTQGLYAPGSTFKMIVALAGLKKGIIDKKTSIFCEGKIEYGDRFYHCWKTKGHGKVELMKAIKESCDCYFYDLAKKLGIKEIASMAKKFGLGELTDIQLPSENRGVVPSKKWKKEKLKKSWYAGETLITGIGQGYLLATPLQMAVMTALIANNGKKLNVTLLKKQDNSNLNKIDTYMNINKEHLKIIKDSMYSVVNEPGGTAYKIKNSNDQYLLSGKTGTSQVKKITVEERESEDFRKKEIKRKDKDHSLFVAYMPSENPRIAISVVAEHEGSGSSTAAPMAKEILDKAHMLGI